MRGGDVVGDQGGGVRWGFVFEIGESVFGIGIGDRVGVGVGSLFLFAQNSLP